MFILEDDLVRSKKSHLQWGSNCDERECSKSIWPYLQFTQLLSTVKEIPKDPSARIDDLVQSATMGINSTCPSENPSELLDLKVICGQIFLVLRYIPVKVRMPWSKIITLIIGDCISNLDCVVKKKFFLDSNFFPR